MSRWCPLLFGLVLPACVLTHPLDGARCGVDGECVEGYFCVNGRCSNAPVPSDDAGPVDGGSPHDAGSRDAGTHDAGLRDGGDLDSGPVDAGPVDAGLVDAGLVDAGAVDAGLVDAGELDAGPVDAGDADGGTWRPDGGAGATLFALVHVRTVDEIPTDEPIRVRFEEDLPVGVDFRMLDEQLRSLPVVRAVRPWATKRLYFRAADALPPDAGADFALFVAPPGARHYDLDEVFAAGSDFENDGGSPSTSVLTAGASVAYDAGHLLIEMSDDEGEAAVVRLEEPIERGAGFIGRALIGIQNLFGPSAPPPLVRQIALLDGAPPAPITDNFDHINRELMMAYMTSDGAAISYTTPGFGFLSWDGSQWTNTYPTYWGPLREEPLLVTMVSDPQGAGLYVIVQTLDGVLLTQTTPVPWDDVVASTDGGPVHLFVGEPFEGPGAAFYAGDVTLDSFSLRYRDGTPDPDVTVELP